jgi:hypothetical protein
VLNSEQTRDKKNRVHRNEIFHNWIQAIDQKSIKTEEFGIFNLNTKIKEHQTNWMQHISRMNEE